MKNTKLGEMIKEKRVEKGIDQESLACALGRSRETVSRYESLQREVPTRDIKKIAQHLEVDPLEMLEIRISERISAAIREYKESK